MKITHPKCGKSWSGQKPEHCSACCETFGGTGAADIHRAGTYGVDRKCLDPANVALRLDARGIWVRSGSLSKAVVR
ncbi:FDXHR family putative zinc-binding protein [Streptomyces finlayi]|uniref:FDXHR family putative zinc-binding protein n=1 Tax=Streptomyces finlayi TaxID=67296 RepID=UPI003F683ECF